METECDRMYPEPENDKCEQAEAQFMAVLLNIASSRISLCDVIEDPDPDLGMVTIEFAADFIDGLLSNPARTFEDCERAQAIADRINNGAEAGCGGDIDFQASMHVIGGGANPGSTKEPLAGIVVGVYDASAGSCAIQQDTNGDGISHQEYEAVVTNCTAVISATTDATGLAVVNVPPGDYIIISYFDSDGDGVPDQYLRTSADGLVAGQWVSKHLKLIKDVNGNKKPGKTKKLTGSELLIIEPEYVVWDDTEQLYPFIFETIGDWSVTTSVAPPEGFVADYDSLAANVDNEIEAVQFMITEVGSDLVPTETTFQIQHKGQSQVVHSRVDIFLTSKYAQSRGFDVAELRARGLIKERPGNQKAKGKGKARANPHDE